MLLTYVVYDRRIWPPRSRFGPIGAEGRKFGRIATDECEFPYGMLQSRLAKTTDLNSDLRRFVYSPLKKVQPRDSPCIRRRIGSQGHRVIGSTQGGSAGGLAVHP